ncbi:MAG: UrcA family protein [Sphingomonadales bacterium]|jgi:UrcA family protein
MFTTASSSLSRSIVAAAGALLFAGACLTAAAGPAAAHDVGARSTVVHYDDLNLNTKAGQKTLKARVSYAARQVCQQYAQDAWARAAEASCQMQAINAAKPKMTAAADADHIG